MDAGSVTGATSSNSGYSATIASTRTLTFTATDSGCGENTHGVSVTVVDSLNAVIAPTLTPGATSLVFEAACEGSGTADDGATWAITSDEDESTYEEQRGIHYGAGKTTAQYAQLVSNNAGSGTRRTIKSVVVNASDVADAKHAALTVLLVENIPQEWCSICHIRWTRYLHI